MRLNQKPSQIGRRVNAGFRRAKACVFIGIGPDGTTEVAPLPATIDEMALLLADLFAVEDRRTGAAWRPFGTRAERPDINLKFLHGAAQGVAVHAQFAGGLALVAAILLEHGHNETLFEFTNGFRIKDVAFVHLQDECFQLVFH